MTKVSIKYNPYTVESVIKVDDVLVESPNKLADYLEERLQVWVENLIPCLYEVCNDTEYEIDFYGTNLDYSDLSSCIGAYCSEHPEVSVKINFTEAKNSEDRFNDLLLLFDDMQKTCPFEDLTTDQVKENFNRAISSEFDVSVIATMSSGKSTLINALLGTELMPYKNEACTATIARIKDIDGMDHFEAKYLDKDNNLLGSCDRLTLNDMESINNNPEVAYIDIEGDVPSIESKGVKLVLVDTPGPNNSRTEDHKNHTYKIIKEKSKPMVLYVLNATQLQTNDDKELLSAVADAMKVGGKQSKDRFLFALNKIDLFDAEKESVSGTIENVKTYLSQFGIENPNIFPTSAETAKVIRMYESGGELSSKQKMTLRNSDYFIEEEQLHLSDCASLSRNNKDIIERMLNEAKASGDNYKEALIYSGVPSIELAINEYLEKYAYTTKIKTAVDTFKKRVEEKNMQAKMMSLVQEDEEARDAINGRLVEVKKLLDEGKCSVEFREKIESLDMMKEANKRIAKLRAKINKIAKNDNQKSQLSREETNKMIKELEKTIPDLQADVITELSNIIEDVIYDGGKEIIAEYKKHISTLISLGEISDNSYKNRELNISIIGQDIPSADELVNKYQFNKKVGTGKFDKIKNPNHKWWDLFGVKEPYKILVEREEVREFVDAAKVYDEMVTPIVLSFFDCIDKAKVAAQEEADSFKAFFMIQLDQLEEVTKRKVEENEKLTRDKDSVEKRLAEEKDRIMWLDSFMKRLDNVLAI